MSFHSVVEASQRAKRTRVLISAMLLTPAGTQKVTVRNISRTGAQLLGAKNVPADCDAIFRRGAVFAAVRIAWVSGDEAGLKFYRQLSPEEIEGCFPAALLPGSR
jgi:hypothetical protein